MVAVHGVIADAVFLCRIRDSASGPPATDGTGDSANDGSYRTRKRADCSTRNDSGDTTGSFAYFVASRAGPVGVRDVVVIMLCVVHAASNGNGGRLSGNGTGRR
jgi:hypothetical protein